ncbi:hypothetical protein AAFP30_23505 [Gordonia sp. CPCC 205515]|uniref:hypothetical protein n=1 Tax=Gordonia sp. CPCC 205515 TaxID=3140791 RepID=UPI003AF38D07
MTVRVDVIPRPVRTALGQFGDSPGNVPHRITSQVRATIPDWQGRPDMDGHWPAIQRELEAVVRTLADGRGDRRAAAILGATAARR